MMHQETGVHRWEGTCSGMNSQGVARPRPEPRTCGILGHEDGAHHPASHALQCTPQHPHASGGYVLILVFQIGTVRLRDVW